MKRQGLPEVRPWKIFSIKSSHTDIGLHNSQYIQRHGSVKHIRDAAALVDADQRADTDPAVYRYIMEGFWVWHNYPMDMGETAAANLVSEYIRSGRLDVGATCAGNHTHVFGYEELCRSTYTKKDLEDNWGIRSKTMLMIDNPGISRSVVAPYANAGVENIVFAPNQWNPFPSTIWPNDKTMRRYTLNPDAGGGGNRIDVRYASPLPMVFFWESPDASAKILVWASTQYASGMDIFGLKINGPIKDMADVIQKTATGLKTLEERYPYDIWLAANYDDDEPANTQLADFASALEDRGITMDGHLLSYHIRLAEYSGLLCSGDLLPLRHSYALSAGHNPRRGGAESGNGSLHPLFQHVFMTFATHSF